MISKKGTHFILLQCSSNECAIIEKAKRIIFFGQIEYKVQIHSSKNEVHSTKYNFIWQSLYEVQKIQFDGPIELSFQWKSNLRYVRTLAWNWKGEENGKCNNPTSLKRKKLFFGISLSFALCKRFTIWKNTILFMKKIRLLNVSTCIMMLLLQ